MRLALRRHAAITAVLGGLATLAGIALIAPLAARWASDAGGRTVGQLAAMAGIGAVAGLIYLGWVRPRRRWAQDRIVARFVGAERRELASDLLSSVELATTDLQADTISNDLVDALLEQTAERIAPIEPGGLLSPRPVRRARLALLSVVAVYALVYLVAPGTVRAGWKRLVTTPPAGPFGGAALSETPLVGDISITLDYPPYTHRPATTLPPSSGDVRVMPGTTISIETRALSPVTAAQLVFGDPNAPGKDTPPPVDMQVDGRTLRARFSVTASTVYRFLLVDGGDKRTERTAHQIEIEADATPSVELYAPADELDVTSMKRIELAYIAEDDYGIAKIELVVEGKGSEQRRALPLAEPGRRSAQAKYVLDLAELQLEPGVRVAYHVEVTDNDDVIGPNVGKSKVYYLRVFSPRERHEALIDRQQELFEKVVRLLGGRLVVEAEDVAAHRVLQRDTASVSVELGSLVAALAEDSLAAAELSQVLTEMRARLDKLARGEDKLLDRMAKLQAGGQSRQVAARLGASDKAHVSELEDDVLLLADWIDRQRMEMLLAITDEIKSHQDRLKELFKEYARTGSEDVKKEIERELKALDKALAELQQKQGSLPADVLDQYLNKDAPQNTDQMKSCTDEVRELLAKGDADGAQKKLQECSLALDTAAQALQDSLHQLRGDKFSDEEKKLGEVMNDLADLSRDQNDIAEAADDIWERYADRADEAMRDTAKDTRKKLGKTIDKLQKELAHVPGDGLTPFAQEELDIAKSRVKDIDKMLADGDIAEALAMAKQAQQGLETIDAELESSLEDEPRGPFARKTRESRKSVRKAGKLADEIVDELESSTPSPEQIMDPDDRRALDKLRRRQRGVKERAKRLAKKIQGESGKLPGRVGTEVPQRLGEAGEPMDRAEKQMRARDPSGAKQGAREAADKLDQLRKDAQGAARQQQSMGGAGLRDEPVRIPGADEYKPPEKFREDILEAMKKDGAPDGFGDMVRRYYEELIK